MRIENLDFMRFRDGEQVTFPRQWIIESFEPYILARHDTHLELRFPGPKRLGLFATSLKSQAYFDDDEETFALSVMDPCPSPALYDVMFALLRRKGMVLNAPKYDFHGFPPVIVHPRTREHLSELYVRSAGNPVLVKDAAGLMAHFGLKPGD